MKMKLLVALVALATFPACKKKGANEALAKLQETTEKVCAAKDLATATKVQDEYVKWTQDWAKDHAGEGKAAEVSEADTKAFGDATKKLSDCFTKLSTGDKPAGDKPAGDKPAGDKPAGDKPADPSASEKPAGDKPAGDKPADPASAGSAAKPADGDKK
jgi:hypothetical protein